ncbi:hypothetical protein OSTOST_14794, partial [Ostertagia ostertagi]
MSESTPQLATPLWNAPKKRKPMSPQILANKAPEALPLLEQLLAKLSSLPMDAIHAEKRERSVVIHGVPEAEAGLSASLRQQHTERCVSKILDVLDIETRPLEVFRMGKVGQKPRLIKCVFSSRKFMFETLSKAKQLRSSSEFSSVFMKSMTPEQRAIDRDLRNRAYELNRDEHNGERVFVVYKGEIVKASEIQPMRTFSSKKLSREYAIVRCDRSRRAGGGVAMFIRKTLNYSTVISESVPSGYEILAVDVALPDPCVRIVLIYRPPSSPPSINEQLGKVVSDLAAVSMPVLVVGDFNIPEFDWAQWNNIRDISHPLFDTFATHGFKQYVDHPTRGNNLLDLLFSNDGELIKDVSVKSPIGHSDHFCVSFKITGRSIPCTPVFKRLFTKLRSKSLLTDLKLDGRLLVNDLEKANALASEFDKVFQQDNNCLPPYSPNVTNEMLTFPYFDANDIYNLLKNWPCSSSITPDQVPFEFVKNIAHAIAFPLSYLFNQSI